MQSVTVVSLINEFVSNSEDASKRQLKSPRTSQFWQRRYYDFNVYTAAKTIEKLKYMHRNPVRRGLVARPEECPRSSYRHYETGWKGTVELEFHWTSHERERKTDASDEDQ